MMKAEPTSPRLDHFWPKNYDDNRKPKPLLKRVAHSGSPSPPNSTKHSKPYFPNKSWVRRPSDASETSTLVGSSSAGTLSSSGSASSLLNRLGMTSPEDDSPSLLRRMQDPEQVPTKPHHPKRKPSGASASPTRPQEATLSEARDFAERLIQEALHSGMAGSPTPLTSNCSKGDNQPEETPMDLDEDSDYASTKPENNKQNGSFVDDESFSSAHASESAVDELLARGKSTDNSPAPPSPSLDKTPSVAPLVAQTNSQLPPSLSSPQVSPSTLEGVRQILLPIVLQNALRRDANADQETIKRNAASLLTDEQCLDFIRLAQETKKQLAEKEQQQKLAVVPSKEEDNNKPDLRRTAAREPSGPAADVSQSNMFNPHRIPDSGWPKKRPQSLSQAEEGPSVSGPSLKGKEREPTQDAGPSRMQRVATTDSEASSRSTIRPDERGREGDYRSPERSRDNGWNRDRIRRASYNEHSGESEKTIPQSISPPSAPRHDRSPLKPQAITVRIPFPFKKRDQSTDLKVKKELLSPSRDVRRSVSPNQYNRSDPARRHGSPPPWGTRYEEDRNRPRRRSRSPDVRQSYPNRYGERRSRSPSPHMRRHRSPGVYDRRERGRSRDSRDYRSPVEDRYRRPSMTSVGGGDRMDVDSLPLSPIKSPVIENVSQPKNYTPRAPAAMLTNIPPPSTAWEGGSSGAVANTGKVSASNVEGPTTLASSPKSASESSAETGEIVEKRKKSVLSQSRNSLGESARQLVQVCMLLVRSPTFY
ncbi:hypothetical protein BXZ70DRAFT_147045 [Cristinia sonorae]|uniref:Uncharacterized protein n=1 Tax=Cristinia sonorae TaxID=1940300 RepID=A0A8K0UP71_9AGAR|nr:hypothetical protein BXZ70DRAFT_147045 [Cristinia sonorae]